MQYPDKWLRLVGIPIWAFFFRFIGEITPLGQLLSSPQFYMDVLVVMGVTALLWEANRFLICYLDRQYSWARQAFQRLFLQAGVAFGGTALVIAVFSFVYNDLLLHRSLQISLSILIANDVPIGLMFILILHMGYTMYWMLAYHRTTVAGLQLRISELETPIQPEPSAAGKQGARTLLVNQGKGYVPLLTEQIAYIFVTNETSIVKTHDNQSFTVEATLEQLSERLSTPDFFRISRQFIASRNAIRKVENDGSGRALLTLYPRSAEEVAVSRRRLAEFRHWLSAS